MMFSSSLSFIFWNNVMISCNLYHVWKSIWTNNLLFLLVGIWTVVSKMEVLNQDWKTEECLNLVSQKKKISLNQHIKIIMKINCKKVIIGIYMYSYINIIIEKQYMHLHVQRTWFSSIIWPRKLYTYKSKTK